MSNLEIMIPTNSFDEDFVTPPLSPDGNCFFENPKQEFDYNNIQSGFWDVHLQTYDDFIKMPIPVDEMEDSI